MERAKVKGWNRARKILAMYKGNRILMKKVHNYYIISVYPNKVSPGGTFTYFEHWKKMFWEALPTGKLNQKIDNALKIANSSEFIF